MDQAQGASCPGAKGPELVCPWWELNPRVVGQGLAVGGDESGGPRPSVATQALPESLDFVLKKPPRGFKHRMRQWACPWEVVVDQKSQSKARPVKEVGQCLGGVGDTASTCRGRSPAQEGQVGTGMSAFGPRAGGPRGVDRLRRGCADGGLGVVTHLDGDLGPRCWIME